MSWYLDLSLLLATLAWATNGHRTGPAITVFILLYTVTSSLAILPSEQATSTTNKSSIFVPCEANTTLTCLTSSLCLPISLKCDGTSDCQDSSDEADCRAECSGPDWLRCHNDHCISATWKCDGENDCMDWSDEDDDLCRADDDLPSYVPSPFASAPCSPDQFRCLKDGQCIPSRWTCDGQADCRAGEDEEPELCKDRLQDCSQDLRKFACGSGECISRSWFCDGSPDCSDSSDESSCPSSPTNSSLTCDSLHGSFLCQDGQLCLNSTQVCDSVPDCKDKSDEAPFCLQPTCNLACEQGCLRGPSGPSCFCRPGFLLNPDLATCSDIDECEQWGVCSQLCTNLPGGHSCSCLPGYTSTNGSCLASQGSTLLLFSTKTAVRGLNLTSSLYFPVARDLPHVIGVGFDSLEERVYWTDVMAGRETIHSSLLDGGDRRQLVTSGLDMPEDLVVDETNRNLYFTDSIAKRIGVCSLDSSRGCAVLATDVEQPRAIALHVARQLVLFTDWGTNSKSIGQLGMDGKGRRSLVTKELGWPNGLAVDTVLDRVFWSDARLDKIESIRLDGGDRRVVLDTVVKHPFSLAVFEDRLYWSDWENRDLVSANKFTGKQQVVHMKEVGVQPFGITVSHPVLAPNTTSPCFPTSPCSHLCLPSGTSPSCLCPSHLALAPDGHSCTPPPTASRLVLSSGHELYTVFPQSIGLTQFQPLATLGASLVSGLAGNTLDSTLLVLERSPGGQGTVSRLQEGPQGSSLVPAFSSGSLLSSITYDPRSRTVFWTDLHKMAVMASSLHTGSSLQLASSLSSPLSLLLVPQHDSLVLGERGRISLLPLSPQEKPPALFSSRVQRPSSLAYSPTLDALFIGDPEAGAIYRQDWSSSMLQPVLQELGQVTGLAVQGGVLYWVEKGKAVLFWVTLTGDKEVSWMSLTDVVSATDVLGLAVSGNSSTSTAALNTACLSAPCSHLCLPGPGPQSYSCLCPYGMALAKDLLTCTQDCPDDVFSCGSSGHCVPLSWRCDGTADCLNGADETNCTVAAPACNTTSQAVCSNGDCLPANWWCDGDVDCTDGTDEGEDCPMVDCGEERFKCRDGKQCLVPRWRCDGDADCRDGSDEAGCGGMTCDAETEFACTDGLRCVQASWECDEVPDCHDASDELDCSYVSNCTNTEFICGNGNCVDTEFMCDGVDDCGDGSEEEPQLCHNRKNKGRDIDLPVIACWDGVQCGSRCLPSSVRCNGTWECPDYSDEADCPICTPDTFRCYSGERCVPRTWLCDRIDDCSDGSDEAECDYKRDTSPPAASCDPSSQFLCLSGECLSLDRACNGLPDCSDSSDESTSCSLSCSPSSCSPSQLCRPTPLAPVCSCLPGFTPSPSGQCQDTDECQQLSACAQTCTNTKGSYKCSCGEGFQAEGALCRPRGDKPKFLYALGSSIRGVEDGPAGHEVVHQQLTTHAQPVASFVFNSVTGEFFWSSPALGLIGMRSVAVPATEARNLVWLRGLKAPAELALDWRASNLYFSSQRSSAVTVCSTKRKVCREVARAPEDAVTRLAVDPQAGLMFVAGYSRTPRTHPTAAIYPYTMAGQEVAEAEVLGGGKTGLVSGLALDTVKQLVFWSDLTSRDLRVCSYLGSQCGVVAVSSQPRPQGLLHFSSKLFWTSGQTGWLHSFHITTNVTEERTLALPTSAHSLMFSHPSLQPSSLLPSPCSSLTCSHLCLLTSPSSALCSCPTGFSGSTTCLPPSPDSPSGADSGPLKEPVSSNSAADAAGITFVLLLVLLIVICCVFVKCRNTKSGGEVGVRFTNMAFGLPTPGRSREATVELATAPPVPDRSGSTVGYSNPSFDSPSVLQARATGRLHSWSLPDSPSINRDTPVILEGRNTPLHPILDNDSAFQEPSSMASSYAEDECQHLSVSCYKDKHRLMAED